MCKNCYKSFYHWYPKNLEGNMFTTVVHLQTQKLTKFGSYAWMFKNRMKHISPYLQGLFCVWAQPMRHNITMWHRLSLAEPIHRMVLVLLMFCVILRCNCLMKPPSTWTISFWYKAVASVFWIMNDPHHTMLPVTWQQILPLILCYSLGFCQTFYE